MAIGSSTERPRPDRPLRRVALAALAASFGSLLPLSLLATLPMLLWHHGVVETVAAAGQFTGYSLLVVWPIALFVSAVAGMPIYYWLNRSRTSRQMLHAMLGAGLGVGAIAASLFWLLAWNAWAHTPAIAAIGATMGGAAAFSFWLIVRS
jgi:hypothetical protein